MKQPVFKLAVLPVLAALVLAGCSLAPKYERPVAPVPQQFPDYGKEAASTDTDTSAQSSADLGWREFFRDPQLLALIDIALANNRDLRIAAQRVQEARAQYGIQQSEQLPTFGVGGTATHTRNPQALRMNPDSPSVSRVYQAGVGITSFELDFFGRIRNLTEAARQAYLATEQAQRTVHIGLVAGVAEGYFNLRAAEQQYDLAQKTLVSRQNSMDIVQARFDAGVAGALDLNQARSQLETVRADLSEIQRAQAQAQNALRVLLGEQPPVDIPRAAVFGKDQLLASIPVGLPSDLLTRRPDIIGAEHTLMGANANIGAARAAFFPNISITGLLGFASPAMGGLFSSSNKFWTYSPQLTVPLFSGGVSGNLDLAEARKNIAVAQYEKTIQVAFREVADALAGEATYSHQLDALRALEDSAAKTVDIARMRYENGIDSFLQVQSAEVSLYSAQRQFVQTGLASLVNRVELYKALGGGWNETSLVETADTGAETAGTGQTTPNAS